MLTHGSHSLYLKYSTGDCFVCLSSVAVMMLTVVTVPGSQTNLLLTPHFATPSGWLTPVCDVSRSVTCHVAAARHIVTRTHAARPHALVGPFIFRSAAPPLCQAENKLYLKWIKYNGTRAVTRAGLKTSPMLSRSVFSVCRAVSSGTLLKPAAFILSQWPLKGFFHKCILFTPPKVATTWCWGQGWCRNQASLAESSSSPILVLAAGCVLELETNLREDWSFTITEKVPRLLLKSVWRHVYLLLLTVIVKFLQSKGSFLALLCIVK